MHALTLHHLFVPFQTSYRLEVTLGSSLKKGSLKKRYPNFEKAWNPLLFLQIESSVGDLFFPCSRERVLAKSRRCEQKCPQFTRQNNSDAPIALIIPRLYSCEHELHSHWTTHALLCSPLQWQAVIQLSCQGIIYALFLMRRQVKGVSM